MLTLNDPADPVGAADRVREAVNSLAEATRAIENPASVGPVLESVTSTLAALSQTLHQLGAVHDNSRARPRSDTGLLSGDAIASRAATYSASWEIHRAAEMIHQVADGVARAREIEATITREAPARPPLAPVPRPQHDRGLSL